MKFNNKMIIIAECNFLQDSLWQQYVKNNLTLRAWDEIKSRLQSIRNAAREDEK